MKNFRKIIIVFLAFTFATPRPARADFWGGDLPLLAQILANTIQQLAQLKQILGTAQDNLDLIRDINRGLRDVMIVIKSIDPNADPGIYREWQKVDQAVKLLQDLYGVVVPSQDSQVQRNTDQSIAEAIAFNNSLYDYTKQIDEIGEEIKQFSHDVSPGGAQRLTAQSMGVMLHVMNQNLRAHATGLKLQAQALALENKKEKENTKYILDTNRDLRAAMQNQKTSFALPRF